MVLYIDFTHLETAILAYKRSEQDAVFKVLYIMGENK